jgi:hypothetical protein
MKPATPLRKANRPNVELYKFKNLTTGPEPPDTARDVQIAADTGYTIYVNCKPSQDAVVISKIETGIRAIITDASSYKDYIATQPAIKIIVGDLPTDERYVANSKTEFVISFLVVSENIIVKDVIEMALHYMKTHTFP